MIKDKTILKVNDNSGVQTVKCIKILGGYKKKFAKVNDFILISIKSLKNNINRLKIKRKSIFKGIIIQTKHFKQKKIGFKLNFKNNIVILLDKQTNPLSTRINGFIPKKFKTKFKKITAISYFNT